MAHTDNDTVVAKAIRDLLILNKINLGIDDVLYGFHNLIPNGKTINVKAMGKERALIGVQGPGGRTDNALHIGIDVHSSIVGDEETERNVVDDISTAVEDLIHNDTTIGGIIIHGFITSVERGVTQVNNINSFSMFRSVIMVFTGTTRTLIA